MVRVAASMRRESRAATTVALTRLGGSPLPAGCARMARRGDRVACLSVRPDALWFGLETADMAKAALRLEWLGAPRKGRRFVHGVLDVPVRELSTLAVGQLVGVLWAAAPGAAALNRSALVDDFAVRDGAWCVDLTLTR